MALIPAPHLKPHSYILLPSASLVDCDICHLPIPARSSRFHCYQCSDGDYDVCTECYASLVAAGKISQANGPTGWRRCLHGHRMAVVGHHDTSYRDGHVRLTLHGQVGGRRLREDLDSIADAGVPPPPAEGSLGKRYLALYNRFPPDADAEDLVFPKNATLSECEDLNADWAVGVYAGEVGVFPRNHARRVG